MQAIILCGGQGTRLRSVIGENQKTMIKKDGKPFLVNLVMYLKAYDIYDITFATGYKSEEIEKFFGDKYFYGVKVHYAKEEKALGTGGAVRNCLKYIKDDVVLVLNGDTLFPADLTAFQNFAIDTKADICIACREQTDKARYGTITVSETDARILSFNEKVAETNFEQALVDALDDAVKTIEKKYINGGIYLLKKSLIEKMEENKNYSLEKEVIPGWIKENYTATAYVSDADFIDIGTPESYDIFMKSTEKESKDETV